MLTTRSDGIYTIANVLNADECREYVDWSESLGYESAPISLAGGAVMRPDLRNNVRVMIDDKVRAAKIWSRLAPDLPRTFEGRRPIGLNERLRFYRYGTGQYFAPHTDGCHRRANGEESLLTLMIYLNGGIRGGETAFEDVSVTPEPGLALVFDHYLLHEGVPVLEGFKYVLRSDIMFAPKPA
jgi:hypothetical protein